jgi:hypothetical protein
MQGREQATGRRQDAVIGKQHRKSRRFHRDLCIELVVLCVQQVKQRPLTDLELLLIGVNQQVELRE